MEFSMRLDLDSCERKIRHLRTIFGPIGERDENRTEILNDMKLTNYDARLEASSRLMSRQASRFRDLPAEWRDGSSPSFFKPPSPSGLEVNWIPE